MAQAPSTFGTMKTSTFSTNAKSMFEPIAGQFLIDIHIDLPFRQINDPSLGKDYSLPVLPATPPSPSQTLEGTSIEVVLFDLRVS